MANLKKLVALDIGNVCVELHLERLAGFGFRSLAEIPESFRQLDALYETGRIGTEEFFQKLQPQLPKTFDRDSATAIWNSLLGVPVPGMEDRIIRAQNFGVKFVFFTDINAEHIREIRRILPFAARIPDMIASCEVGACKPAAPMYEAFERKFGKPDFYFDDRADNIAAGKARGWNAIAFHSSAELDVLFE